MFLEIIRCESGAQRVNAGRARVENKNKTPTGGQRGPDVRASSETGGGTVDGRLVARRCVSVGGGGGRARRRGT